MKSFLNKYEFDRKEQRQNSKTQHDMMANHRSSEKAKERFRRPAYQVKAPIREQGEQMERNDVLGYMDKLGHDVKGEMPSGKEDS